MIGDYKASLICFLAEGAHLYSSKGFLSLLSYGSEQANIFCSQKKQQKKQNTPEIHIYQASFKPSLAKLFDVRMHKAQERVVGVWCDYLELESHPTTKNHHA